MGSESQTSWLALRGWGAKWRPGATGKYLRRTNEKDTIARCPEGTVSNELFNGGYRGAHGHLPQIKLAPPPPEILKPYLFSGIQC
jgi:hypothetical protein